MPARLMVVQVRKDNQIPQFKLSCSHCSFPDNAFFLFTVSDDHIDIIVFNALHPAAECHARANSYAITQGPGYRIHTRNLFAVRVALQEAAKASQPFQFIVGEISLSSQRSVKDRTGMSFGKDKSVPFRPLRILRVKLHLFKEQDCHNIRNGHARARMPVSRQMHCLHYIQPKPVSYTR